MTKIFTLLALTAVIAHGADQYQPTAEEQRAMQDKLAALASRVKALAARHADADLLADVDVYRKAAEWILRYPEEFYTKAYAANTLAAINRGTARAKELESSNAPAWAKQKGRLVRAYISPVDGSVQPYGLIIPESYSGRPVRLDLVMHGKGATLNEVSFIAAHDGSQPVPADQDFITLEVFGRTNPGYRWAGEADVFEALASVRRRYNIDPQRIVLRGFSMGGHGAWHVGLHYPGMWAATEAGAGFTETVKYAKLDNLPPYQQAVLHIYDAVDYSVNAFDAPVIGYGGEIDPQLQASTNIREQLTAEGFHFEQGPYRWTATDLRALFLIGPNTPHRFHPDSKKVSDEYIEKALETAGQVPSHLRFVTYTTRYNRCYWITVDGLEKTYERADVDATRVGKQFTVSTKNVSRLKVSGSGAFTIDGQTVAATSADPEFEKKNGKWRLSNGGHLFAEDSWRAGSHRRRLHERVPLHPSNWRRLESGSAGIRQEDARPLHRRVRQMDARRSARKRRSRRLGERHRRLQPGPVRRSGQQQCHSASHGEAADPLDQDRDRAGGAKIQRRRSYSRSDLSESA